ncbi:hypothetical protein NQ318_006476 [Aromia moschata]|uniref:DDE-1 domain-containing protein n=1 Tax=Aromia moschata TaxID=1265417 RepID=A0AAV8X922_9CUCU|nr:hypothetical protein NQ318_006476 [Aromia moschata]
MAGWKWVSGFLKRNPQISLRTPENTSLARAQDFNKPNIGAYFLALSAILAKYNFPPENMYNMDESGLSTVQKKSQKIYASKGRKQVGAVSSAERGKHVTIVCAMNAIGTFVPPAFIFPRERMKDELMNDAPVGSVCFAQEKGWMTTEIFLKWLKHFLRYTKASKENPVLLLLDGHGSHKGLQAMEFAKENGIIIFCFPAHCSHHVQPLDVGFFRPLHTYYDQEIELWLRNNPGKANAEVQVAHHENSLNHKSCILALRARGMIHDNIQCSLTAQLNEEISYWKNILKRVVAVIKGLASRGLAFRGKDGIELQDTEKENAKPCVEILQDVLVSQATALNASNELEPVRMINAGEFIRLDQSFCIKSSENPSNNNIELTSVDLEIKFYHTAIDSDTDSAPEDPPVKEPTKATDFRRKNQIQNYTDTSDSSCLFR